MTRPLTLAMLASVCFALGCTDDAESTAVSVPEGDPGVSTDVAGIEAASPGEVVVDDSAEGAVKALIADVAEGKTSSLWAALPESYQSDINEVVQGFGNGVDPAMWGQIIGTLEQLHGLLTDKAEFIINTPTVQNSGQVDQIRMAVPGVAAFLKILLDNFSLEALKSFDGEAFFAGPAAQIVAMGNAMSQMLPGGISLSKLNETKIETVSEEGDSATLKMTNPMDPDQAEEVEFVRVDGHWLPADLANDWDANMEMVREQLKTLPETSQQAAMQVGMVTGMVNAGLAPLQQAEDQESFNKAFDEVQQQVMGMAQMFGGFSLGGGGDAGEGDDSVESPGVESSELEEAAPSESE